MKLKHCWQDAGYLGFDYQDLYSALVVQAPPRSIIVELGVAYGQSLTYLAVEANNAEKGLRLYGIDRFGEWAEVKGSGTDGRPPVLQAERNLQASGATNWTLIRGDTAEKASIFEDGSVFAVFVDASHQHLPTLNHIDCWWPKLQMGGILCGHDWCDRFPGVEKAVRQRFLRQDIELVSKRCWQIRRTGSTAPRSGPHALKPPSTR